jgi:hypothetical protein
MEDVKFASNVPDLISEELANKLSPEAVPQASSLAELVAQEPVDFEMPELPVKKVKINRFWYNGNLITREEHDKLSVDEILASNNIIRRRK